MDAAKTKISIRNAGRQPRDVYCYFDNTDAKLRAPFDAELLIAKLRERGNDVLPCSLALPSSEA